MSRAETYQYKHIIKSRGEREDQLIVEQRQLKIKYHNVSERHGMMEDDAMNTGVEMREDYKGNSRDVVQQGYPTREMEYILPSQVRRKRCGTTGSLVT